VGQKTKATSLLLKRILELWLVLATPKLAFFLGRHMFRIHLHAILFFEFANESWVPQLTGDPKVLATAH